MGPHCQPVFARHSIHHEHRIACLELGARPMSHLADGVFGLGVPAADRDEAASASRYVTSPRPSAPKVVCASAAACGL